VFAIGDDVVNFPSLEYIKLDSVECQVIMIDIVNSLDCELTSSHSVTASSHHRKLPKCKGSVDTQILQYEGGRSVKGRILRCKSELGDDIIILLLRLKGVAFRWGSNYNIILSINTLFNLCILSIMESKYGLYVQSLHLISHFHGGEFSNGIGT
jgi:hypothetical protein